MYGFGHIRDMAGRPMVYPQQYRPMDFCNAHPPRPSSMEVVAGHSSRSPALARSGYQAPGAQAGAPHRTKTYTAAYDDEPEFTSIEEVESGEEETAGLLTSCGPGVSGIPEKAQGIRGVAQTIAHNEAFKSLVAVIILANTISMAAQLDYEDFAYWQHLNHFFLLFFICEIGTRLYADGCKYFFCHRDEWAWNVFDFTIVSVGVIDTCVIAVLEAKGEISSKGTVVLLTRVLRMFRVLRVLRLFRRFKKLHMLARGLVESVVVVIWIAVLVFIIIFMSAIFTTTTIGQKAAEWGEEKDDIRKYWGSVGASMFTLFQFLTMDDWNSVDMMVVKRYPMLQFFFFPYIFFGAFVIMSLLTGVMADHVNEVRGKAEQEELREKLAHMDTAVAEIQRRDKDGDGKLNRDEFVELFPDLDNKDENKDKKGKKDKKIEEDEDEEDDDQFQQNLEMAEISLSRTEAIDLFDWFDVDGDEQVTHQELRFGLKSMFDGMTPLQLYKLSATVKLTESTVYNSLKNRDNGGGIPWWVKNSERSKNVGHQLDELAQRSEDLDKRFSRFEATLTDFMKSYGYEAADGNESGEENGAHG